MGLGAKLPHSTMQSLEAVLTALAATRKYWSEMGQEFQQSSEGGEILERLQDIEEELVALRVGGRQIPAIGHRSRISTMPFQGL